MWSATRLVQCVPLPLLRLLFLYRLCADALRQAPTESPSKIVLNQMTYREKIDMLYKMGEDTTKIPPQEFDMFHEKYCICGHHHGTCGKIEDESKRFDITIKETISLFFPLDRKSIENNQNPVYHGKKVMAFAERKMKTKRYRECESV